MAYGVGAQSLLGCQAWPMVIASMAADDAGEHGPEHVVQGLELSVVPGIA